MFFFEKLKINKKTSAEEKDLSWGGIFVKRLMEFVPAPFGLELMVERQAGNLWENVFGQKKWKKRLAVVLIAALVTPISASPAQALFGFGNSSTVPLVQNDKIVSFLVEERLLDNIKLKNRIENYASIVQENVNGEVVLIPIPLDASPLDIYEGNAHLYFSGENGDGRSQLIGTILIGDVPLPIVEKGGTLWPTIFPYVDFEDTVYEWNYEKERFVFRGGGAHQAEVWHGLIRPDLRQDEGWKESRLRDLREDELIAFFDTQNQVDDGTISYGEKMFSADLIHDQVTGLDDIKMQQYNSWIDNIEDIAYLRFTKHWAKEVMEAIDTESAIDVNLLPDAAKPPAGSESADDMVKHVPDVHTKLIIEDSMKRYFEAWRQWLSIDNSRIEKAGRWGPEDVDRTITLVSLKDENAALKLKEFNDNLDAVLNASLGEEHVAKDVRLDTTINVPIAYEIPGWRYVGDPPVAIYSPTPAVQNRTKNLYWNGVLRSALTAEDCSLLRGSPRSDTYLHAQMVEGSRAYILETRDEDYPDKDDPDRLCEDLLFPIATAPNWNPRNSWWSGDDDYDGTANYIDIYSDVYQGCCAVNTDRINDIPTLENNYCDTGSEWVVRDYQGDGDETPYPPAATDAPTLSNQYREHTGATEPIFDITGTKEVTTGVKGAEGCDDMLILTGDQGMNSLVYHIEPTAETITAQLEQMETLAMPIDKPRGFSFYDEQWDFHKLQYFNVFKYIGRHSDVTDKVVRKALLKEEILEELQQKIEELNGITNISLKNGQTIPNFSIPGVSNVVIDDIEELITTGGASVHVRDTNLIDGYSFTQTSEGNVLISSGSTPLALLDKKGDFYGSLKLQQTGGGSEFSFITLDIYSSGGSPIGDLAVSFGSSSQDNQDIIDSALFDLYTDHMDDVLEALIWIDEDIEEKNKLVLETALSPVDEARTFLLQDDFHDGYEFVNIIAEKVSSKKSGQAGQEGIAIGFEQGEDPESSQFREAKLQDAEFSFDDGSDISDLHKKDESHFDFSGQEASGAACNGKNILTWFPCFLEWLAELPDFLTQTFTIIPDPPKKSGEDSASDSGETEKPKILAESSTEKSASGEFLNQVSAIKVSTPEIHIGAGDRDPVLLEAELKNKAGSTVSSRTDSLVEIEFGSSNADKFFEIFPSKKIAPVAGKAVFTLFPKDTAVGGKFEIVMKVDGKILQRVPVTVSSQSLEISLIEKKIVANDKNGLKLEAKVEKADGSLSFEKDGKDLLFTSDWGTFANGGQTKVVDGRAEMVFFPGVRSGEATIRLQDSLKLLAPSEETIDILPGEIAGIALRADTEVLLPGIDFISVKAQLQDEFGNDITDQSGEFLWETENLEVQGIENSKSFKTTIEDGKAKLLIRPKLKLPASELIVKMKLPLEEIVQSQDFEIPQKIVFHIETDTRTVIAGSREPLRVLIEAQTKDGKLLRKDVLVNIVGVGDSIGKFRNTIQLKDGLGEFEFFAGIKSGTAKLLLSSPGFEISEEAFEVDPAEGVKILASTDSYTMDMDDPHGEINLDISVVDRFGNIDTSFADKIYLLPNEPDIQLSSDREGLIEMGVIDEASGAQLAIEEDAAAERAAGTSPDTSLLQATDGWSVPMITGKATLEITPGSASTGKVLMSLESPGLVPDTVAFTVTDYLTADDVDALTPKSIFSLLLGFDGGDMLSGKGIANRYLFSGKSQAVGTLLNPPDPLKRIGYLSPNGEFASRLTAELMGDEFFTVNILDGARRIAQVHAQFEESPRFSVKQAKGTEPGIYFVPNQAIADSLERTGEAIFFQDNPLFAIMEKGGLLVGHGGLELDPQDNSFLDWRVSLNGQQLGVLSLVPAEAKLTRYEKDDISDNAEGIFVRLEISDIHMEEGFTGRTTNESRGLVFLDPNSKESESKKLGARYLSAENVHENDDIVWTKSWKAATRFAAGSTVGDSVKWHSSDAFILLGDPTASVPTENSRSALGISADIGKPVWKSSFGNIDQIIVADINADEVPDILNLVGKRLFALYQENSEIDNFRDTGPILRFEDGVDKVLVVDNDLDNFADILQLNNEGKLILHKNTNGTFARESVTIKGFEGVINQIFTGNINDDDYRDDLVFSDTNKTLWFAPGTNDVGVYGPVELIEGYAPTLETITETYEVSKEQDWTRRKYVETQKFPNLSEIFITYRGSGEDVTDETPDGAIRKESSQDLLPETAFTPDTGEGGFSFYFGGVAVSQEALSDMAKSLQKGDKTMDEQLAIIGKKVLGKSGGSFQKTFLEIPFQTRVDAEWTMAPADNPQLQSGDIVRVGVSLTPKTTLNDFEFMIPTLQNMELVPDSISCTGCTGELKFREDIPGDVLAWGYWDPPFTSGQTAQIQWDMRMESLGVLDFQVFDFKGNDTIDDILIGWEEDGEKKLIQHVSSPWKKEMVPFRHERFIESVTMPYIPQTSSQDSLVNAYQADSDGDGLPDVYKTLGVLALSALTCGGCGLPVPSVIIPPFAPGSQSLYQPPLGFKLPAYPMPTPVLSILSGIPFVAIFAPKGGETPAIKSVFRMYIMPTTTAQIGIGFCLSPYAVGMKTMFPAGNCITVFPPLLEALGVCASDDSDGTMDRDALRNMAEGYNPAVFKPNPKKKKPNKAIHAAEIINRWIDAQKDEWTNIKLPNPKLWLPKFPKKIFKEQEKEKREEPLFEETNIVLGKKLWKSLEEIPWITVKPERHTFPYPVFPKKGGDELSKYHIQWEAWKKAPPKYEEKKKELEVISTKSCKEAAKAGASPSAKKECKELSEKLVSFEAFIDSVKQNEQAIANNWKAIQSYEDVPKELKKLFQDNEKAEGEMTRLGKQFKKYGKEIDTYTTEWLDANKKAVGKWKKFSKDLKEFYKAFSVLFDPFFEFTTKCPTCAVERGSSTTFLINLLGAGLKLPVIPAPRLPDILLDFSEIDLSVQLVVPEIELQPVDMSYPNVPSPPKINVPGAKFDIPALPVIPVLPAMPKININIPIPELTLPTLPVLLDPPGLPGGVLKIKPIIDLIQKFLDLFCLIVQGIIPVPEWYLAGHVQQMTNRTLLFNLDFNLPSLSPNAPQVPEIEDIEITIATKISLPTGALEIINETVRAFSETDQCIVNALSQILKGGTIPEPCSMGGGTAFVPSSIAKNEVQYTVAANMESNYFQKSKITQTTVAQKLQKTMLASTRFMKTAFAPKMTNVFSTISPKRFSTWLTSVVDVGAIPTEVPDYVDVDAVLEEQNNAFQRVPAIYYFDPATKAAESITDFPVGQVTAYTFADLGDDHEDEILYAIGDELYLKYRVNPTIDADDLEKKYEQTHRGDYDNQFGKLIRWDYETFRSKFAPAKEVIDSVEATGTTFQFERIFNGVSYFEWLVTDRPDFVFEIKESISDRISNQWERNGFLLRPKPTQYEIRPMTTKIEDIKGSPILYTAPSEKIPRFKQRDCDNDNKEKPFFATQSLLVGIDKYSRFEIRVPPLPGQPEQKEEKVLRRGEETIVEYGEVCLTRGDVERIDMTTVERIELRENTYLPSGSRMELGNNDRVKLKFYDGTETTINENEKYTLRVFQTEDELIRAFELLDQKNQYGAFQGFTKYGDSFFFSKYLHDPQGAHDTVSPEIFIVGGTKIDANIFTPVSIDASRSRDRDGNIARVWWDLYPAYDNDKDGDPTNDWDFPIKKGVTPREVLKVSLPAYETAGTSSVILHVEDEEGNHTQETLFIKITASDPQLQEATVRGRTILGSVRDAVEGVPITIERNRRGEWETINQKPILTNRSGDFSLMGLGTSGGVEILDFAKKDAFEILENGRPILYNDLFDIIVQNATQIRPTSIVLRDEQRTPVATIGLSIPGEKNVVLDTEVLEFTDGPSVHVFDRNLEDAIKFEETKEGNVLISGSKPLALIDKRGDFYSSLKLRMKATKNEDAPVVFEIFGDMNVVIGEFAIVMGEEINMYLKRESKRGERFDFLP